MEFSNSLCNKDYFKDFNFKAVFARYKQSDLYIFDNLNEIS